MGDRASLTVDNPDGDRLADTVRVGGACQFRLTEDVTPGDAAIRGV